jgi:hypothetical protein
MKSCEDREGFREEPVSALGPEEEQIPNGRASGS